MNNKTGSMYYIIDGNERTGPFDIIIMIKKIKNGSITAETVVADVNGITRPAGEIEELADLLKEDVEVAGAVKPTFRQQHNELDLNRSMKIGWNFVMENQMVIAYAGLLVAVTLILGYAFSYIPVIGYIATFVISYLMYSAYFLYAMRTMRGQHVDFAYIKKKVSRNAVALTITGLIATIVFSASIVLSVYVSYFFMLLSIPGLFIWTALIFAPLLIFEGDMDFQQAISLSKNRVKALSFDSIGVIFGLVVITYVAVMCLIAPAVFALPIVLGALVEIYEELFNH